MNKTFRYHPRYPIFAVALILVTWAVPPSHAQAPGYISGYPTIEAFDPATGQVLNSFPEQAAGSALAVSADGTKLYLPMGVSGGPQSLEVVSSTTGELLSTITPSTTGAGKVVLSPNENWAYVKTTYAVDVVNLLTGAVAAVIQNLNPATFDIALSPDGTRFYVSTQHSASAQSPFQEQIPDYATAQPTCPASPQGVCVFNTSNLALIGQIKDLTGYLAVSQDGKSLYAWSSSFTGVVVVNTSTLALSKIATPKGFIGTTAVVVAPSGTSAVMYGAQGSSNIIPYILNTQTNRLTGALPALPVTENQAAYGNNFASFSRDGSSIWTIANCLNNYSFDCTAVIGQSFPGGETISQIPLTSDAYKIAF